MKTLFLVRIRGGRVAHLVVRSTYRNGIRGVKTACGRTAVLGHGAEEVSDSPGQLKCCNCLPQIRSARWAK